MEVTEDTETRDSYLVKEPMPIVTQVIRRVVRRFRRPIHCGACNFPHGAGRRLISGPGVYICESCVADVVEADTIVVEAHHCSFCHRRDTPIAKEWPGVVMCNGCVALARTILSDHVQ